MKLVTANGDLLELNRGLIKNSSGYDLRHLVIGAEGTLGFVVEATLRLTDQPPASQVMLFAVPAMDALMRVFEACRAQLTLERIRILHRSRAASCRRARCATAIRGKFAVLRRHRIRCRHRGATAGRARSIRAMPATRLGQRRRDQPERCAGCRIVEIARRHHRKPGAATSVQERYFRAHFRGTGVPRTTCRACWRASIRSSTWSGSAISATATCTSMCSSRTTSSDAEFVAQCERVTKLLSATLVTARRQHFRRARHRPGQESLSRRARAAQRRLH